MITVNHWIIYSITVNPRVYVTLIFDSVLTIWIPVGSVAKRVSHKLLQNQINLVWRPQVSTPQANSWKLVDCSGIHSKCISGLPSHVMGTINSNWSKRLQHLHTGNSWKHRTHKLNVICKRDHAMVNRNNHDRHHRPQNMRQVLYDRRWC